MGRILPRLRKRAVMSREHFNVLRENLARARQEYEDAQDMCMHVISPLPKEETDELAVCEVCSQMIGWKCPESPDHVCHYASHGGGVILTDGCFHPCPIDHDPKYESSDSCIFCFEPYERK